MSNLKLEYIESLSGGRLIYEPEDGYSADAATSVRSKGTVYSIPRDTAFILTGYVYHDPGDTFMWAQTTTGLYIYIDFYEDRWLHTWSRQPNYTTVKKYTATDAERLVQKIIHNNIQIVQNNLVCARYASKFTNEQQELIRELQNRADMRKDALIKSGLCENVQTSYPKGYSDLSGYLDALMQGNAIGIATWVVVVIAATVIAATATAAYFAYKELADQSEKDVKYSKELTAVLTEKLTAEEYQQLLDETKGIVTKSRLKQAIGSYGRVLWIVGALVAGAFAYKFLENRFNG